jgi:hypothetical protein
MVTKISEYYLTQLVRKLGAKNRKILLFIDHCAAYPKNNTFLSNIKAYGFGNHPCIQMQLILKTVAMMDAGLLQDATLNSRVLEIDNTDYNQELLCEVWFLD